MVWTERTLEDIKRDAPYELHTVHPDGGTEVLNRALLEFVQKYGIRVTRSRPYPKNDNPVAESRNFTLIRVYMGYCRYDTDAEYEILKELIPLICKLHNYFMRRYQVFLIFELLLRIITLQKKFERVHKKINFIWVRFYFDERRFLLMVIKIYGLK